MDVMNAYYILDSYSSPICDGGGSYISDERVFNCLEFKKSQNFSQIFPNGCPLQSCHKTNFTNKFYRENLSIFLVWWGIHHLLKFCWNQSLFWIIFLNFNSSFTSEVLNADVRHLTRSGSTPRPKPDFRTLYSSPTWRSQKQLTGALHTLEDTDLPGPAVTQGWTVFDPALPFFSWSAQLSHDFHWFLGNLHSNGVHSKLRELESADLLICVML